MSRSSEHPLTFYLAGPTAVGKTDLAVALAVRLNAEIVGCDAFQIYQGLPILTAKPSAEAMARVPHHLVGEIPLTHSFDVAQYREMALSRIATIHSQGKTALVVGGTGMYLRALAVGFADLPPPDLQLRHELESSPLDELHTKLQERDPISFQQIDLKNRRRVIRALEVCILAGRPFSSFREQWGTSSNHLHGILLVRDRTDLYERINRRVEQMLHAGALEEVATSGPIGATASQTLGLKELQSVLNKELSQEEAIESIQQATRHYAKRQLTWFRREAWLQPLNLTPLQSLEEQLSSAQRLLESSSSLKSSP